ncbi:unnamed protein product [Enterobius vermicularis]|uniref:B box-type domain-containing protein n=1 Tax=Enterobius vermicularis TaxID=51028 RepID=A0A0N4V3C7_ENTVE|nr:unnamed protein product [Enterobius vermicularis]
MKVEFTDWRRSSWLLTHCGKALAVCSRKFCIVMRLLLRLFQYLGFDAWRRYKNLAVQKTGLFRKPSRLVQSTSPEAWFRFRNGGKYTGDELEGSCVMDKFNQCDLCFAKLRSFRDWCPSDQQGWLLPCLHVVCSLCKVKSQVPSNPQKIICRLCRTECSKHLLLLIPNTKSCLLRCETRACPEKKVATFKCLSCNELLCQECSFAHRRVTATSSHVLQPIVLMTESCTIDITFEVIHFVLHFQASCSECLQMRIHEGPHHIISPISHLAASSSVEEEKIKSSSARELTLIEATLSSLGVRKQVVSDRITFLKKEIGTSVVKACNAIIRRGWDLINTLDFVENGKIKEFDHVIEELKWQQIRFKKLSRRSLLVECYHGTSALLNYKEVNEQNVL